MTTVAVTRELDSENRIGVSPDTVKKLVAKDWTINIVSGAGERSHFSDAAYADAGATIVSDASAALKGADIWLTVRRPDAETMKLANADTLLIGMIDPFGDRAGLDAMASSGLTSFAMEFMPRITRAQSMDVLSSQANLAGYKAVVDAAAEFGRALPMMMTAAGTVPAARVFVMGAGVAGLQAIATARRLGAIVTATDVRPAAKEQVASLGAKFVAVEDDEFKEAETAAGYAKEMSDAYKEKQAALVSEHVAKQDIVITTALIPGRPAPTLVTNAMVANMQSGSVIVDLAAERGGNCEGTKADEKVVVGGVTVLGPTNLAGDIPGNASSLYAKNLLMFLEALADKETNALAIDWDDEVVAGTLIAKDGAVVHPRLTGEGAS